MRQQQSAVKVNDGELPDTSSMTDGYVFRVENPVTVSYLRHIGRTGRLVTAEVSLKPTCNCNLFPNRFCDFDLSPRNNPFVSGIRATLLYLTCPILTIIVFALLGAIRDWWAVVVLGMLVLARFINVVVVKRRNEEGWKGGEEDGLNGDLLIVLSQDRWTSEESFAVAFATPLVYASAALAGNATTCLQMFGRVMRSNLKGDPKGYGKRLDMVKELIRESGKTDWAIDMRLIKRADANAVLKELHFYLRYWRGYQKSLQISHNSTDSETGASADAKYMVSGKYRRPEYLKLPRRFMVAHICTQNVRFLEYSQSVWLKRPRGDPSDVKGGDERRQEGSVPLDDRQLILTIYGPGFVTEYPDKTTTSESFVFSSLLHPGAAIATLLAVPPLLEREARHICISSHVMDEYLSDFHDRLSPARIKLQFNGLQKDRRRR
ncbi:hypothetical protein ARMSODRAFT_976042 [Armillaria solidipes]|uniref:Uncharacterized protein n=1 Tax=Armillaria solidipes TaxID=1076256 RepID=A0A2H3BWA4_9AGAR|nr:hypothetical protein ARMSODRAFT_976042 [Armillaria solidipes]